MMAAADLRSLAPHCHRRPSSSLLTSIQRIRHRKRVYGGTMAVLYYFIVFREEAKVTSRKLAPPFNLRLPLACLVSDMAHSQQQQHDSFDLNLSDPLTKALQQNLLSSRHVVTWSCDASYAKKDGLTSRTLSRTNDIGRDDLLCVYVCVGLIRLNERISTHSLSMCIRMVFHPCASFDGLLNDSIWCRSLYSLLADSGE